MDKFIKAFFSMRMMVVAIIIFFLAIGTATFLESIYDIQTAKLFIYNALWFEILLVFLALNLIANIFRYQMFRRSKIAMLSFHLSFIIILIGAGITRYMSFEGLMLIREGASSNFIYSSDPMLYYKLNDGKLQLENSEKMFMSEVYPAYSKRVLKFPNHKNDIKIEIVDFRKNVVDSLIMNRNFKEDVLAIVTDGMKPNYLSKDSFILLNVDSPSPIPLSYEYESPIPGIVIKKVQGKLMMKSKLQVSYTEMAKMRIYREMGTNPPDSVFEKIPNDTLVPFESGRLYVVDGQQFVFKSLIPNARLMKIKSETKNAGKDLLKVKITDGTAVKTLQLEGGMGVIPEEAVFEFQGLTYQMSFGASRIKLPFSIFCKDFELERYPGSEAPSSFASEVRIEDPERNYVKEKRIFMNNVIDYRGFRFFQSSYDEDEKGTRLSVNYDKLGTNVTYIGYLLMAIGMILSLFASEGRFKDLIRKLNKISDRKSAMSIVIFMLLTFGLTAQNLENNPNVDDEHAGHNHAPGEHVDHADHDAAAVQESYLPKEIFKGKKSIIDEKHSEALENLIVQDYEGRFKPFHTLATDILNKISRKNNYKDYNAIQIVMGMQMYFREWIDEPIFYVSPKIKDSLHLESYTSLRSLIDDAGNFKWQKEYNVAFRNKESKRDEFQKNIIKLLDHVQVMQMVISWSYFKILPESGDKTLTWHNPLEMSMKDKGSLASGISYINKLDKGVVTGNYTEANKSLSDLKKLQRSKGNSYLPAAFKIDLEVSFNKMRIFSNAQYSYFLLALVLLIIWFVRIFMKLSERRNHNFNIISKIFLFLTVVIFVYHGVGLGMRWYISGHAPWSDGYEVMIFISWVLILVGLIFSRRNSVVIACALILAFFILFVASMNLLDPAISRLQPVLKSYWLMIHVAIITASYAFLGLAFILGLLNLILFTVRNKKNGSWLTLNINELTYISEMTMTIGLFMLTIGTFLGGIWANESWGRYWGWDPKETWALVSVLVYAMILHLRYIPGLQSKFLFSAMSFWGFSAILFTFFGVNFVLVGLHSYAQGDGLAKFPVWLIYTIIIFIAFTVLAAFRNKSYKRFIEGK